MKKHNLTATSFHTALPCLALVLALCSAAPALAADADADSAEHYDSDTSILVTATRHIVAADTISASLTVLDKAALDRAQDMGVSELLLRTPSISIHRNGGYGTSTSLRIRGAESDHTVVVIDGVKLNDPAATGGGYNMAHLMLGDAAQIEVLRGPQSILWGSQAIGGVINISTASPTAPIEGSFDIEAGSRNTVNSRLAVGGKQGRFSWRIGGQSFTTDGISAISPKFGGVEKDGYRNRSLRGRAAIDISDTISFDFGGYYGSGRVHIDATTGDSPEYAINDEYLAHAGLKLALFGGRLQNRFTVQYTDTSRENLNPLRARPLSWESNGTNKRAEYQGEWHLNASYSLIFGADYEKSEFRSRSPAASLATPLPAFARGQSEILGFYTQFLAQPVTNLHLHAGVRHDDHDSFGGNTLFSAGGRWNLGSGTTLRASYGEGFKAPSLYQLYSEYGNDALSPEHSRGWEAGIDQSLFSNRLTASALYFERSSTDQIIYNGCSSGTTDPLCYVPSGSTNFRYGYYSNIARSEARGIETAANLRLGAISLGANYSWILSEDRSPAGKNYGKWLNRRPRETANLTLDYRASMGLELGGAVRWSGKSYDNATNSIKLDGYTLVDIRAEMPITPQLRVFARAENLFDQSYMTAYRYGSLGRSIYAGLRGRF